MADQLRISLVQSDICWENREASLLYFRKKISRLRGRTDLAVLPEMFTTGFSMNVSANADTMEGNTVATLKSWAEEMGFAITGSFIAREDDSCFNRAFFITPSGECHTYDKRHLFRMAGEHNYYSSGSSREIIQYKGWNIRLLVCYDLRFPVWSRNVDNAYDLLIYVANWPDSRISAWNTLLPARAVENLAYVCGVNRIGVDGKGINYSGCSAVYSPKGSKLARVPANKETTRTCAIGKAELNKLRQKFPVWKDADPFRLL